MSLRLVYDCPTSRGLAWRSLLTVIHSETPNITDFGKMHAAYGELVAQFGHVSSLTVLLRAPKLEYDSALKERSVKITRDFDGASRGGGVVLPVEGLRGSFTRSVITGISLIARPKMPQKVFSELRPALDWISALPGQPPELPDEVAALERALVPHLEELRPPSEQPGFDESG